LRDVIPHAHILSEQSKMKGHGRVEGKERGDGESYVELQVLTVANWGYAEK